MKTLKNTLCYTAISSVYLLLSTASAAPLTLDQVPLFTKNSAKPNLLLAVDDSGSMDFETLFSTTDGGLWWSTGTQSFVNSGQPSTSGTYFYTYLFPNGSGSGNRSYSDSDAVYSVPPLPQYMFARSSHYNKMYYDPDTTYTPWVSNGSTTFGDVSPSAAPSDPTTGSHTLNLTIASREYISGYQFSLEAGMALPAGTVYYDTSSSSWLTLGTQRTLTNYIFLGLEYYPATYYVHSPEGTDYSMSGTAKKCSDSSPDANDFVNFEDNPSALTSSGVDSFGPDGRCLTKVEIKSGTSSYVHNGNRTDCASSSSCTYAEEIQNFANWYTYYRKRHLALRGAMGLTMDGAGALRTGLFTINTQNDVTMRDMSVTSDVSTLYNNLYAINGTTYGTPNRTALDHAGEQYQRTNSGAPITAQCQKNFTLLFTDGYSYPESISTTLDDDSGEEAPYKDSANDDTLADVAIHYYKTNLRSDLTAGKVPADNGCRATSPDPSLDCNTNLHMNTYTVGLGAEGTVFGVTHNKVADAYVTTPTWPDVSSQNKNQIDDLYHAAVNGRGEIYNADSATDLQTKLQQALVSIQSQLGSSTAVTFNTASLQSNSQVFIALFNSANWSGDLLAYDLDSFGNISSTSSWSAASQLDDGTPSASSRVIITRNATQGTAFQWSNLTSAQQADLNSLSAASGQDVLNYLRGDRSNETAGKLRIRDSLLGDIVNGSPVYVGTPSMQWPSTAPFPTSIGTTYSDFLAAQLSSPRDAIVYAGSNDGMLHGFNAATGEEEIAYIPSYLFSSNASEGLHYLADPQYQHRYYVDLTPTVSDVYIDTTNDSADNPAWTTVLLGGSRAGGKGLFLLNITDPGDFSESSSDAEQLALWEFTHTELGYTFSKPTLAMMENGRWAAIFGNGYNNSGTGEASLFIVFLDGGIDGTWTDGSSGSDLDYIILSTQQGDTTTPNGLVTPTVLDTDRNGAADRVYAGDLLGNMWAFDLSDATTLNYPNSTPGWDIAYKSGSTPVPLFIAKDDSGNRQPITSPAVVRTNPAKATSNSNSPNILVLFGTGKFLEASDTTTTDQQSFYGVWDHGDSQLERSSLVEQVISTFKVDPTDPDSEELRTITENNVNYNNKDGWYIDFPTSAERHIVEPSRRGSLVFFNTWIPSSDACAAGGRGYLMSVEVENGGLPETAAFDTNNDNKVDDTDQKAAGEEFNKGLPASSRFLGNKQYTGGTGRDDDDDDDDNNEHVDDRDVQDLEGLRTGRLSWQELSPE